MGEEKFFLMNFSVSEWNVILIERSAWMFDSCMQYNKFFFNLYHFCRFLICICMTSSYAKFVKFRDDGNRITSKAINLFDIKNSITDISRRKTNPSMGLLFSFLIRGRKAEGYLYYLAHVYIHVLRLFLSLGSILHETSVDVLDEFEENVKAGNHPSV